MLDFFLLIFQSIISGCTYLNNTKTITKRKTNKYIMVACTNTEEEKNKGKISWPEEVIH